MKQICEDNHSFMPINDYDVDPGIDIDVNEDSDDENGEDNNEVNVSNNNATLYGEDGDIIMYDGLNEYDEFNIPIIVVYFRLGGRHALFGSYRQLVRPSK